MTEQPVLAFLEARWAELEAEENSRRIWTENYFCKPCPACEVKVTGVGLTGRIEPGVGRLREVYPCNCELPDEEFGVLVGEKSNPNPDVLRQITAERRIADLHVPQPMDERTKDWYRKFHGGVKRWCIVCANWADAGYDGPGVVVWPCPTLVALAEGHGWENTND